MTTKVNSQLKQKILGVLMKNARQRAGLGVEETANYLGVSTDALTAYEFGQAEADLPTLEALARLCSLPVDYFWAEDPMPVPDREYSAPQAIQLRRKVIGVLLNKARTKSDVSQDKIAKALDCPVDQVIDYELGQKAIPFSHMEVLTKLLDVPLDYFFNGTTLAPTTEETAAPPQATVPDAELEHLPDDVVAFLKDPANVLYIKLAMRLHSLSADTLRALAEGILDITY